MYIYIYTHTPVDTKQFPQDPVLQVTIDYVMMTTGARYGNKIDSTKAE